MTRLRVWLARAWGAITGGRRDAELAEEIAAHLDLLAAEHEARGLSPDAARLAARREFGGVDQVRVRCRDARGVPIAEAFAQDLRHAARGLRRQPGFALGALVTLALAIGCTTAIYSLVYGVLLRPLPYPGADQLVRLWEEHPGAEAIGGNRWLSQHTHEQWAQDRRTLSAFGGYTSASGVLEDGSVRQAISGAALTPSLVGMLGLMPLQGRWFTEEDAREGALPVMVISAGVWRDRFGGRADIAGTTVRFDGEPREIVGVAPPSLQFPSDTAQFWVPYAVPTVASEPRRTSGFNAIGRLADTASARDVEREGTTAARAATRPMSAEVVFGKGGPVVVHARRLREDLVVTVRPALLALAAAVLLILLVACANVASLLLARGVARQREFAIRTAIGASRGRLITQTLIESGMIASLGGAAGIGLAWAMVRVLPLVTPQRFPRLADIQLDGPVLAVAALTTLAAALLSGVVPALRSTDRDATTTLRSGDGGVGEGFRGRSARRWRDGLLVVEAALAVILLVGALLLGHSLSRLMNVDPGYTDDGVVMATISMPRGTPPERASAFVDQVLEQLRQLPTVAAAAAASTMPMVSATAITSFPIEPAPGEPEVMTRSITYRVTTGYAETMGLRLREGRFFDERDTRPGVRAIVVNEEFARRYMKGSAVGRRFDRLYVSEEPVPTEIIGVIAPVLKDGHHQAIEPELYFLHRSPKQLLNNYFTIAARAAGPPREALAAIAGVTARVDSAAVIDRADLLETRVATSMAQPRFATIVAGVFAVIGVLVASAGLLSVLSYAVAQRRRELSVRAALGAGRTRLVAMIVGEGLAITSTGIVLGLLASAALTRLLASLLFQVSPHDPLSFVLAVVVLIPVSAAACLLPAYRAAAADPAVTLRGE